MSTIRDDARRGIALLVTVVTMSVCGLVVLALVQGQAAMQRSATLDVASARAGTLADSVLPLAHAAVRDGAWRALSAPGMTQLVGAGVSGRLAWRATVGRAGWQTLVLRAATDGPSGVRGVPARGDRRVVVPLVSPLAVPLAALTGAAAWDIPAGADVTVPVAAGKEVVCRDGTTVTTTATWAGAPDLAAIPAQPLDADTVTVPIEGVFRLVRPFLGHPLRVTGMVVLDSELDIGADLELSGVLVTRGVIQPAGGRLQVTGAVLAGDAGGGHSGLGAADRVRYDACAVRRAVERITHAAARAAWTPMQLF